MHAHSAHCRTGAVQIEPLQGITMNTVSDALAMRGAVEVAPATPERVTSWAAIAAGAVAAAALSLILLALGTGLGLSAVSPWSYEGASAKSIGIAGAAWLLLMSALASGLGGYLAGRLRAKWIDVDADEAFFRDTAHGFLAWAVATVISAAVLTSAASSMVGTAVKTTAGTGAVVAGTAVGGAAGAASASDATRDYFVDMMFRGGKRAGPAADDAGMRREAAGILTTALTGEMAPGDRAYLAQEIVQRTGMPAADADQLVTLTVNAAKAQADAAAAKAREVAEAARQATAYTALWVFASLLLGAFSASLAATWGGKQREPESYLRRRI
jgi:hypothetical protein